MVHTFAKASSSDVKLHDDASVAKTVLGKKTTKLMPAEGSPDSLFLRNFEHFLRTDMIEILYHFDRRNANSLTKAQAWARLEQCQRGMSKVQDSIVKEWVGILKGGTIRNVPLSTVFLRHVDNRVRNITRSRTKRLERTIDLSEIIEIRSKVVRADIPGQRSVLELAAFDLQHRKKSKTRGQASHKGGGINQKPKEDAFVMAGKRASGLDQKLTLTPLESISSVLPSITSQTSTKTDKRLMIEEIACSNEPAPVPNLPVPRLSECCVCLESFSSIDIQFATITSACKHTAKVCLQCIKSSIKSQIQDLPSDQVSCPMCPELLNYQAVRKFADNRTFQM